MLIAHRGLWNKDIKENTLEAFNLAIHNPLYAGFELDIYMSSDKEFVIHHNALINGKFIWNYSSYELNKLGVIKLEKVLNLNTDKIILIDIKDININTFKLTKLLNKYNNKNIYVMSFFNSVIKKIKNNNFKIGILNYVLNSEKTYSYDFIGLLYDVVTFNMVNSFLNRNIEVFLYAISKKDKLIYNNVYYIVDN